MKRLSVKLNGYFRYYGITDNSECINTYRDKVRSLLFKWLNRRSQRKSYNWKKFILFMKQHPLPKAKLYVNIFQLRDEISYILYMIICGAVCRKSARTVLGGVRGSDSPIYLTHRHQPKAYSKEMTSSHLLWGHVGPLKKGNGVGQSH